MLPTIPTTARGAIVPLRSGPFDAPSVVEPFPPVPGATAWLHAL